jgi:Type II CAAX prenyl endopeptidase Rce1-like
MSAIYPHLYRKVVERWLARPFSAESFTMAFGSRVAMVAAAIGLSFSAQIAIGTIIFALTGQTSPVHHPLGQYSTVMQFFGGSILAPLLETLLVQATGIFIFRRLLRANWTISCVAVGCIFGALHGYAGSALLKLSITGILLTAVFVIEKRKEGKPILMTFATHSIYNTILWAARH